MTTKNKTTTSNQYNASGMNAYNAFQPTIQSNLMQEVNNPFGSTNFKNQLAQMYGQSRQIAQRSNTNLLQNMKAGGGILSNAGGFVAGALNRNQNSNNVMQGNVFNSAVNNALQ